MLACRQIRLLVITREWDIMAKPIWNLQGTIADLDLPRPTWRHLIPWLLVFVFLGTPIAMGSNLLGHRANWQGSIVSFHHVSLETAMHNASHWNEINVLNNQTDIVRQHTDAYSPSGVNHYDSDYGDTWWVGMWNCMVLYGGSICVQGRVRYNIGVYNESNVNYARSIACHEQGHAIGLAHSTGGSSCMFSSPAQERPTYAPHDIAHINALY